MWIRWLILSYVAVVMADVVDFALAFDDVGVS
jgi:hypothetical protein